MAESNSSLPQGTRKVNQLAFR